MGISGHEIARVLGDGAVAGAYTVADPGTGGTIDIGDKSHAICELVLAAAAETRILPSVQRSGLHLYVIVKTSGTGYYATISSGTRLATAGDIAHFVSYYTGSAYSWTNVSTKGAIESATFDLPMHSWKVWDALQTNLPGTAAADDLGLTTGTFLTSGPTIVSVDYGGTSALAYARQQIAMPLDHIPGTDITITAYGAMAVVSDGSGSTGAGIDFSVVDVGDEAVDLVTTSIQSINSATPAAKAFTITQSQVETSPSRLDIRMAFSGTDSGNAAPNINVAISRVYLTYTRRR